MRSLKILFTIGLVLGLTLAGSLTPKARAADFNANTVAELIQAINDANNEGAYPGHDTIILASSATYTLTAVNNTVNGPSGLPVITSQITIQGNGAAIERSSAGGTPRLPLLLREQQRRPGVGKPDHQQRAGERL